MNKRLVFWILFLLMVLGIGCHRQAKKTVLGIVKNEDYYTWDFGQAKEGIILKHTFVLKNTYQKTLNIKDVNTSCGCTVSKVGKNTLLPGEETSIDVSFNSRGYFGAVQQFVYVHTDDLDNPVIRYIIKANVLK